MEMLIFFPQQDLVPEHSDKTTTKLFANNDITAFAWPANLPDLKVCREEEDKYAMQKYT